MPEPKAHGTHPDLSTETLIPSALGSLSTPQSPPSLHVHARSTGTESEDSGAGCHLLHRTQARVPEGTVVTVWLAHSGINSNLGSDDGDREMGAAASGMDMLLERVRKMSNVQIVEAGET